MSCYETAKTYSTPQVPIVAPALVDWNYSPFGNFPSLSNKWPRTQNLYNVPFDQTMVKYSKPTFSYGGLNGIAQKQPNCGNNGNLTMRNAYLSCGY